MSLSIDPPVLGFPPKQIDGCDALELSLVVGVVTVSALAAIGGQKYVEDGGAISHINSNSYCHH
jgi:hypothetical protein